MTNKRFLFTAGERMRGLRELMGLSRKAFAEIVGMPPKRVENIENGWQRMHDEDFQKVCSKFEDFSRWIAYEGPIDSLPLQLKVADSAQKAAVYLVKRNPDLLDGSGMSFAEWQQRHRDVLVEIESQAGELAQDDATDER
ncbi:helix-turn-helix domain-containing protein [Phytopseudomonas dryadis]|uniref:Transcriptional regulator n=1 Tax=Phytopseudomonas dryadis TaxID=2487520 RepID=A0A4Q9R702_9GAMM|nr:MULTISPECIES: helix-turn-helix transcriptional regulator [Pseudomonas]TBU95438.1 transcriptional regulator [Pseudomonas dryadis]TBV03821.1 transcriptional regulator [Pseudomonas dryadis]TBV16038.1 transcriptional regulator [Pseudomonas sp. FRB 230]